VRNLGPNLARNKKLEKWGTSVITVTHNRSENLYWKFCHIFIMIWQVFHTNFMNGSQCFHREKLWQSLYKIGCNFWAQWRKSTHLTTLCLKIQRSITEIMVKINFIMCRVEKRCVRSKLEARVYTSSCCYMMCISDQWTDSRHLTDVLFPYSLQSILISNIIISENLCNISIVKPDTADSATLAMRPVRHGTQHESCHLMQLQPAYTLWLLPNVQCNMPGMASQSETKSNISGVVLPQRATSYTWAHEHHPICSSLKHIPLLS